MAKTNRPLRLLVHPSLWGTAEIQELRKKGNEVADNPEGVGNGTPGLEGFDIVLGPNCWRIVPGMEDQIDLAVKAARKTKYGKKGEQE